jgi:hypothetical protein
MRLQIQRKTVLTPVERLFTTQSIQPCGLALAMMRPSLFNRSAANLSIYDQLATVNAMGRGVVLGRIPILGEKGVGRVFV